MTRQFSGDPVTVWLRHGGGDRDMVMREDFWFIDSKGRRWEAKAGEWINGASIPRALWAHLGSPYTGDHRLASIVHDRAYAVATTAAERALADRMFFEACREGGCSRWQARILYAGLRVGNWWRQVTKAQDQPVHAELPESYEAMIADFEQVSHAVEQEPETDDAEVVEAQVNAALAATEKRRMALATLAAPG